MNSNWMRPFHLHPCPRLEVIVDVDIQAWWYWGVFEENVSRSLIWTWDNGDKQTDVGMTVHINFDLEELLDSQMYCTFWVECDKTAHRLEWSVMSMLILKRLKQKERLSIFMKTWESSQLWALDLCTPPLVLLHVPVFGIPIRVSTLSRCS